MTTSKQIKKPKNIYDLRVRENNSERQIVGNRSSLVKDIIGTGLFYVLDCIEGEDVKDFEATIIMDNKQYFIKKVN